MSWNETQSRSSRVSAGTRLNGIYEVECQIGAGGMGEVYKGHAIQTGDPVAIKMMLGELVENEAALALFRKEASALHYLQHDAIVRYYVFTVEPVLQRPYLAMEFVDGRSLHDILRDDGPLSFEATRSLMQRLASGLQAAHDRGIIHRDVSPDNVIIPQGDVRRAKIIDFGIARSTHLGQATVIGSGFAGKYNYVSPEQLGLFGGDVTAKSDIYSLGLVLVEALTGRPLDMGGNQLEVVEKRRKVPDLGAIDMRIRPLIDRMLQPAPADRPDSMDVVAKRPLGAPEVLRKRDLDELHGGRAASAAAEPPRRRTGLRLALAAALGIAVIAGGAAAVYLLQPADTGKPPPPPSLQTAARPSDTGAGAPTSQPAPTSSPPPLTASPTLTPTTSSPPPTLTPGATSAPPPTLSPSAPTPPTSTTARPAPAPLPSPSSPSPTPPPATMARPAPAPLPAPSSPSPTPPPPTMARPAPPPLPVPDSPSPTPPPAAMARPVPPPDAGATLAARPAPPAQVTPSSPSLAPAPAITAPPPRPAEPAGTAAAPPTLVPSTPPPSSATSSSETGSGPPPGNVAMLPPARLPPPASKPAPKLSRTDQITRYIQQYDGGDCFFISPVAVSAGAAQIEGFGAAVEPFQALD